MAIPRPAYAGPHCPRCRAPLDDRLSDGANVCLECLGDFEARLFHPPQRGARVLRLIRHRISLEEREFLLALCIRPEKMTAEARYDLMEEVAAAYRAKLSVEEEPISGENFVRDLTAILFARAAPHPAFGHPLPASRGEGPPPPGPSPRLRGEGGA